MIGFLEEPEETPAAVARFDKDRVDYGFVMNVSKLWAYQPATHLGLFDLLAQSKEAGGLDQRQLGILVAATASTLGDSYCSVAWGGKLAQTADAATAAAVIDGDDRPLTPADAAMARWARRVVEDPNGTSEADVQELRDNGFDDRQIFAMTVFVALRLAFSTVNDALGAGPDADLRDRTPDEVLAAVDFGRPFDDTPAG